MFVKALLLSILLSAPMSANYNGKFLLKVSGVDPKEGTVIVEPVLPLHITLTGDPTGINKGEIIKCTAVPINEEDKAAHAYIQRFVLICEGNRQFSLKRITFENE